MNRARQRSPELEPTMLLETAVAVEKLGSSLLSIVSASQELDRLGHPNAEIDQLNGVARELMASIGRISSAIAGGVKLGQDAGIEGVDRYRVTIINPEGPVVELPLGSMNGSGSGEEADVLDGILGSQPHIEVDDTELSPTITAENRKESCALTPENLYSKILTPEEYTPEDDTQQTDQPPDDAIIIKITGDDEVSINSRRVDLKDKHRDMIFIFNVLALNKGKWINRETFDQMGFNERRTRGASNSAFSKSINKLALIVRAVSGNDELLSTKGSKGGKTYCLNERAWIQAQPGGETDVQVARNIVSDRSTRRTPLISSADIGKVWPRGLSKKESQSDNAVTSFLPVTEREAMSDDELLDEVIERQSLQGKLHFVAKLAELTMLREKLPMPEQATKAQEKNIVFVMRCAEALVQKFEHFTSSSDVSKLESLTRTVIDIQQSIFDKYRPEIEICAQSILKSDEIDADSQPAWEMAIERAENEISAELATYDLTTENGKSPVRHVINIVNVRYRKQD